MVWDIWILSCRPAAERSRGLVELLKKALTAVKKDLFFGTLHFLRTTFVWYSGPPGNPQDPKSVLVELKNSVDRILKIDLCALGRFIPYIFFLIPAFLPKNQLKIATAKAIIASAIVGSNSNIFSSFDK